MGRTTELNNIRENRKIHQGWEGKFYPAYPGCSVKKSQKSTRVFQAQIAMCLSDGNVLRL